MQRPQFHSFYPQDSAIHGLWFLGLIIVYGKVVLKIAGTYMPTAHPSQEIFELANSAYASRRLEFKDSDCDFNMNVSNLPSELDYFGCGFARG